MEHLDLFNALLRRTEIRDLYYQMIGEIPGSVLCFAPVHVSCDDIGPGSRQMQKGRYFARGAECRLRITSFR